MSNKLTGVITNVSDVIQQGNYKKLYVRVQENQGEYQQSCNFEIFGDQKVEAFNHEVGDVVEVTFNLKCNEYNDKMYNSITAWKIEKSI